MAERPRLLDDCFLHDRDRLRHDEALNLLRDRLMPVVGIESVPLEMACGRIVAAAVTAPRDIPGYDNAAVDGYAYLASAYDACGGRFRVAARIAAGDAASLALPPGTAARIFTGAAMPENADTVAMQEDCLREPPGADDTVFIPPGLKPGANRRRAGEDVQAGETLVSPGMRLRPQDVAAIAAAGIDRLELCRPLRVLLVSTGNEIRRPGDDLPAGKVYDSNHYLLASLLRGCPVEVTDGGILADDANAVAEMLAGARHMHDVVLTTGGASRGEEDHLVRALDRLGHRHMWQLAIKPGRPMCFGQIGGLLVFSLPGNPVAAFVCFLLYVRPALIRLGGGDWPEPARFAVPAGFDVPAKKGGRREFWRGWLETRPDGTVVARKFERDGSGLISGLRRASGLIEIAETVERVAVGDRVAFIPFSEFGIA